MNVVPIGHGALCATWSPSSHEGSSPISKYLVEVKPEGGKHWKQTNSVNAETFIADIFGLKQGNYYNIRVLAENEYGVCEKPYEFYEPVCAREPDGWPKKSKFKTFK